MTTTQDVGARVRYLRETAGQTQTALARKAGLSATTIRNIETGQQSVSLTSALRIAAALGVPATDLVDDQKPSRPKIWVSGVHYVECWACGVIAKDLRKSKAIAIRREHIKWHEDGCP